MIGWDKKPAKKSRPRNRQQVLAEIGQEKVRIKRHTGGVEGHDALNRYWGDYFLRRRGTEYDECSIQIQYALNVFARLGISIEEEVTE